MFFYFSKKSLTPCRSQILTLLWDPQDEKLNTFVLKTYKSLSDYEAENKAYRELRDIRYIVPFYGSYNYNNEDKIILKQADEGSLEDYFRTQTPPSESGDICKFWRNLCPILNALHNIHHVEQESWKWKSREVSRGFVTSTGTRIRHRR